MCVVWLYLHDYFPDETSLSDTDYQNRKWTRFASTLRIKFIECWYIIAEIPFAYELKMLVISKKGESA